MWLRFEERAYLRHSGKWHGTEDRPSKRCYCQVLVGFAGDYQECLCEFDGIVFIDVCSGMVVTNVYKWKCITE